MHYNILLLDIQCTTYSAEGGVVSRTQRRGNREGGASTMEEVRPLPFFLSLMSPLRKNITAGLNVHVGTSIRKVSGTQMTPKRHVHFQLNYRADLNSALRADSSGMFSFFVAPILA